MACLNERGPILRFANKGYIKWRRAGSGVSQKNVTSSKRNRVGFSLRHFTYPQPLVPILIENLETVSLAAVCQRFDFVA